MSLYGRLTSEMWSTMRRLSSSGTRSSKQRLPASMWNTGILRRLQAIADRQLLVSPRISTASGFSASSTGSTRIRVWPMVSIAVDPGEAAARKWSGRRMPSSSKNTSLSE